LKAIVGNVAVAIVLVTATYVANANTMNYGFAYDDAQVILERAPAWEQGWGKFLTDRAWGISRYVTLISLDLNRADPLSPYPFHSTNVGFAAAVAILVFALGRRLAMTRLAALAGALIFALHPVHVDAIVNIIGRAELLAAAFVLLALLSHAAGGKVTAARVVLTCGLFLVAMFCKESAACFLILAPLYDFFLRPDSDRGAIAARYAGYVAAFGLWFLVSWNNFHDIEPTAYVDNPLAFLPAWQRVLCASQILWYYVGLTAWPAGLVGDRSYDATPTDPATGAVALVAWALVAGFAWWRRRDMPRAGLLLMWLPAAFAVSGNVVLPIGTIMADRLLYLPSVGPCLLAGAMLERAAAGSRLRTAMAGVAVAAVCVVFAFAFDARARVWQSDLHFHTQTALDVPRSAKAHYNLALALIHAGRRTEAVASFQRALQIHPGFSRAAYYLAELYAENGRIDEAAGVYRDYLEARPDDAGTITREIQLLMQLRRFSEARVLAERLVYLEEGNAEYAALLGRLERLAAQHPPVSP
jgi:hypothetical protein